nr:hypothetical protein [Tanacetum cinerariifolium]
MRTRRSYYPPTSTIPRRSRKQTTNVVEPEFRTIFEMADNRTMAQMLQAPIEGHNDEIVLARVRISTLEMIIEDIQIRHRLDMKSLMDKIQWIQVPRTKTYQAESDQKDKMRHATDDNGIPSKEIHERHRERAITTKEVPDDRKPLQYVPKSQTDR